MMLAKSVQTPQFGIATYHDGFNFGLYLQAYTRQRTLDELCPFGKPV